MNRTPVAKLKAPARAPPCDPDVVRVTGVAGVAGPIWQHGTVVRRTPPIAASAPGSRWEDPESASPGPAP